METIFYVSILALVLSVTASALYSLVGSYRRIQSANAVADTARFAMERITREARDALSLDIGESTLDVSPGRVTLNTTDSAGDPTTVEFLLLGELVRIKEAGVDAGPISSSKARVTSLIFRHITTAESAGIKVEMTVESGEGKSYRAQTFYSTIVMRGSYELE